MSLGDLGRLWGDLWRLCCDFRMTWSAFGVTWGDLGRLWGDLGLWGDGRKSIKHNKKRPTVSRHIFEHCVSCDSYGGFQIVVSQDEGARGIVILEEPLLPPTS